VCVEVNLCVDVLDSMKESLGNWYLIVNGEMPESGDGLEGI